MLTCWNFLESVTVTNNDHFEIQEDDTPTVKQLKGLSKELRDLRSELDGKYKLIESLRNPEPGGVEKGSSWRDKVAPPGVTKSRMQLQYFPPMVDGERVRVSPPSVVELQGVEKWKDCLVGHFVDKKIPSSQSDLLRSEDGQIMV